MNWYAITFVTATALSVVSPASAQDHSMHGMSGMPTPAAGKRPQAKAPPPKPALKTTGDRPGAKAAGHGDHPATPQTAPDDGSAPGAAPMGHGAMPGMDKPDAHGGHDMTTMPAMQMTGTALPPGNAPAPPPPADHYADRQFDSAEMARAREAMMHEQGGLAFGQLLLNIFEYQVHSGRDGYRWDGEAFYGGDINRFWIKSEGEGELRRGIDSAEIQLLYSRAIDPYFNLQAGIRQDLGPRPRRTYATVGFEGLAPGFFEVEGALFLSNKGDLLARLEGYYDQRITQRLILQPRIELNFAAQDVPENEIGSGLVNVELGARLRYELSRRFGPYVGASYYRKVGDTARLARTAGENVHGTSFVAGVRFWF